MGYVAHLTEIRDVGMLHTWERYEGGQHKRERYIGMWGTQHKWDRWACGTHRKENTSGHESHVRQDRWIGGAHGT